MKVALVAKRKISATFGHSDGVVLDIIDGLPVDSDSNLKPMLLSVDKFFNSFQLADQCSLRNFPIIGTSKGNHLKSSNFKQEKIPEEV